VPPRRGRGKERAGDSGLAVREISHLKELVAQFEGPARQPQRASGGARP